MKVLLKFPHGLGDAVQLTVVLRHLIKHHPDWVVDVFCRRGKETALRNLCNRAWHDQETRPSETEYDKVFDLHWWENYNNYGDRPNTKVTNCLEEVFKLPYTPDLGRYTINVADEAYAAAAHYLDTIGVKTVFAGPRAAVCIHYQGNTSPAKKNLEGFQVKAFCEVLIGRGLTPIILDWDKRTDLADNRRIFCPDVENDLWQHTGTGDAGRIAALISQCVLMVGIDSGPGKVAAATETPTLIVWRGHHPIQFADPAPNVLHLVPNNYREMSPGGSEAFGNYFVRNYNFTIYDPSNLSNRIIEEALKMLPEHYATNVERCGCTLTVAGASVDLANAAIRWTKNKPVLYVDGKRVVKPWEFTADFSVKEDEHGENAQTAG